MHRAVFSVKRPMSSAVPTYQRLSQLGLLAVDVLSQRELSVRVIESSLKYPATPPLQKYLVSCSFGEEKSI